jgi:hypothetical protein
VAYQLTLIRGRIEQRGDLGLGQLLSSHHSYLPGVPGVPKAGRPADPGEAVDQGGALEAEGAADRHLSGAAVSGSAERPARENRDGFPPLRGVTDTAPHGVIAAFTRSRKAARVRGLSGYA